MDFGTLLRSKRKEYNKNMSQLSGAIGLSQPYLSQIERGERNPPSKEVIEKIADFLHPGNALLAANLLKAAGYYSDDEVEKILGEEFVQPVKMFTEAFKEGSVQIQKANGIPRPINQPYFNLEWLLTQDKYEVMYGFNYDITGTYDSGGTFHNRLSEEDIRIIRDMIHAYISNRYKETDDFRY